MTIIAFLLFVFIVAATETVVNKANEEHYVTRFLNKANRICTKAKEICFIAYASVLYWTGII